MYRKIVITKTWRRNYSVCSIFQLIKTRILFYISIDPFISMKKIAFNNNNKYTGKDGVVTYIYISVKVHCHHKRRNCLRRNIILEMAQSNSDGQNLPIFKVFLKFFVFHLGCIRLVTYSTLFLDFLFMYLFIYLFF